MNNAKSYKRALSYLIDLIILFGIGILLGSLLFLFTSLSWYFNLLLTAVICYVFFLIVNTTLMHLTKGRTIGSYIFRIKTVDNNMSDISFRASLVKNLYIGLLPFVIVNAIYFLVIKDELTIFDKITDTVVIDLSKDSV